MSLQQWLGRESWGVGAAGAVDAATRFRESAVLPGITGWAQVNGYRGETDTESKMAGRIAHDMQYIRHWSLKLDLWILALTVIRGFVHKNAY